MTLLSNLFVVEMSPQEYTEHKKRRENYFFKKTYEETKYLIDNPNTYNKELYNLRMGEDEEKKKERVFRQARQHVEKWKEKYDKLNSLEIKVKEEKKIEQLAAKKESMHIAYWEEANQIHYWFVMNIQKGKDDKRNHHTGKDVIKRLIKTCEELYELYEKKGHIDDELIKEAKEKMPPKDGIQFGENEINEKYFEQIQATLKMLKRTLKSVKKEHVLFYKADW